MATAAMVLGVVPLILASGAGAVSRCNMGLVIASGLSIGTLFTLFVVPAVYLLIAADHSRRAGPGGALRNSRRPASRWPDLSFGSAIPSETTRTKHASIGRVEIQSSACHWTGKLVRGASAEGACCPRSGAIVSPAFASNASATLV
jgi:hypothetical protein